MALPALGLHGQLVPCLLIASLVIGCSETPQAQVEQHEVAIARMIANAKRLAKDLEASGRAAAEQSKVIAEEKAKVEELIAKLTGITPVPKPNPAPSPVPAPQPEPPKPAPSPGPAPAPTEPVDGRFGLAVKVFHAALAIKTDDLRSEAAQFAANFREVAKLIDDKKTDSMLGAEKQAYNISVELTKRNKPLTKAHPAWLSPAEDLGAAIAALFNDGKLKNNDDWSEVMAEIANGMEAASKAVK